MPGCGRAVPPLHRPSAELNPRTRCADAVGCYLRARVLLHPARLAAGLAVLHRVHATTAAVGSLLTKKGDLGKRFCRRAAGGSVLCRSCAVEIFCRSSSVYRLYHVLSCINDRTQYSWAMAAHHTWDDQPKGDAWYRRRPRPPKAARRRKPRRDHDHRDLARWLLTSRPREWR